jgi:osmotically-inducible protein OsmY
MKNRKRAPTAMELLTTLSSSGAKHAVQRTMPDSDTMSPMTAMQDLVGIDDAAVTTKLKAVIGADPKLAALPVHIEARHGVVVVSGTVADAELGSRLLQAVASVADVRDMYNQLKIKGSS